LDLLLFGALVGAGAFFESQAVLVGLDELLKVSCVASEEIEVVVQGLEALWARRRELADVDVLPPTVLHLQIR